MQKLEILIRIYVILDLQRCQEEKNREIRDLLKKLDDLDERMNVQSAEMETNERLFRDEITGMRKQDGATAQVNTT